MTADPSRDASPPPLAPPAADIDAGSLLPGRILVLQADLTLGEAWTPPLSPAERARAARFLHRDDALRHSLGRGILRHVLGRLTGRDPAAIDLAIGPEGKPYLEGGPAFNLAHSGEMVTVALAPEGRLGVDVEKVRPLRDLDGLARRSFAGDEIAAVSRCASEGERYDTFFRIWTRKEALVKALGHGLKALSNVSVSAAPAGDNLLLRLDEPGERFTDWTVRALDCADGHRAALAWDRRVGEVRRIVL